MNTPVNNFFERVFDTNPDFITSGVIAICIALALFAFLSDKIREIAPASMVSAGIIGTFWGTFIALAAFQTGTDHQAMVDSIPQVLGGMKSAFVTSLIGLFSAFALRIALSLKPKRDPEPLPIEENTVNLLEQIKAGIIGKKKESLSSRLDVIKKHISSDESSSITSQLSVLIKESHDGFQALDGRMDGLADAIRKSLVENMQNLMEQIQEVIVNQLSKQLRETNKLLREQLSEMLDRIEEALINQFGETFKQFNEATQALKKWQEEHREHVEQLTEAFQATAEGIEKIRADCDSIPATMAKLQTVMGELDERLTAFANMKEAAEQSFPEIEKHLNKIGADMKKSAEGFSGLEATITAAYTNASELAQRHTTFLGEQIKETSEQVAKTAENMMATSNVAAEQHQNAVQEIVTATTRAADRSVADMQKALRDMAQKHISITNDTMTEIANRWGENIVAIAKEMARVIEDAK